MGEERKALKKAFGLRAYMMRENGERRGSLSVEEMGKFFMLTIEDQAFLNS